MAPRRCVYRNDADIAAAVAAGHLSEHDAEVIRRFAEFLRQAPARPLAHRRPLPDKET